MLRVFRSRGWSARLSCARADDIEYRAYGAIRILRSNQKSSHGFPGESSPTVRPIDFRVARDPRAIKDSAGEQHRPRPSSGFHKVACCTSGEFPSCWCRGSATHTVHTCGPGHDGLRRTMLLRRALEGQSGHLTLADRTTVPLTERWRS